MADRRPALAGASLVESLYAVHTAGMVAPASIADLRRIPYFDALTDATAAAFAKELGVRALGPRELLFSMGDRTEGFYFLRSGKARIFRTGPDGREQVLRLVAPGDTFGEVPALDGGASPASVETLEACEVILVPAERFTRLVLANPAVGLSMLARFARRLRGFTELVEQLSLQTVPSRLARYLFQTAREEGIETPDGVVIGRELTMQDLAAVVGSVREVVSRTMRTFEQDGIVEVRRKEIVVRDIEALRRML